MTAGSSRFGAALIGLIVTSAACGPVRSSADTGTADAGDVDAGPLTDGGDVDAGPLTDAGSGPVKLNEVQATVMLFGCGSKVSSCHSVAGASNAGNLNLDKLHAYADLVNVASDNAVAKAAGQLRVKPGDLAGSFLWKKVIGPGAGEGKIMPDTVGSHLPQDQLDLIQQWIEGGALCDPYSCEDLKQTCGDPSDGCGGTHHCGDPCP